MRFRIKICGICRAEDAVAAAEAGADAIGLNFFAGSPRCVTLRCASEIAAILPDTVCRIGVFVNATEQEVVRAASEVPLDVIQLHGDETVAQLERLAGFDIVRAFRCRKAGIESAIAYLEECRRANCLPIAALVDAHVPGQFGGTGTALDWALLAQEKDRFRELPLILAGGLTDQNVSEAIRIVGPSAVDVASGVESEPGVKDQRLVSRFCLAARQAFDGLARR